MNAISGSCLCEAVSYICNSTPFYIGVCNCKNCQKETGSTSSIVVGVNKNDFTIKGEENISQYESPGDSGAMVTRHFCKQCSSPIYSMSSDWLGAYFIKAGTLQDTSWLKPQMHIWWDSAQSWLKQGDDIPKHAGNPPEI